MSLNSVLGKKAHGGTHEQVRGSSSILPALLLFGHSVVSGSCPTLCNPMDCSMPRSSIHHLLEFTQTHVHWTDDAVQPSHSLYPPSAPSLNVSQHQGLFQQVSSSNWVAKVLELSFSISPSNEYSGLISLRIDWLDLLAVQGTLKSLLQHRSSEASIVWCSAFFMVQLSHRIWLLENYSFDYMNICWQVLQGIFLTQGSNWGLLHCRQILYCLSHQGSLLCAYWMDLLLTLLPLVDALGQPSQVALLISTLSASPSSIYPVTPSAFLSSYFLGNVMRRSESIPSNCFPCTYISIHLHSLFPSSE